MTGQADAPYLGRVARIRQLRRSAFALGLIALELLVVGHMAFERHTLSTSGSVVELHASLDLHAHEDRSLCASDGADVDGARDLLCQTAPESLTFSAMAAVLPRVTALRTQRPAADDVRSPRVAIWRTAPKASPPARG